MLRHGPSSNSKMLDASSYAAHEPDLVISASHPCFTPLRTDFIMNLVTCPFNAGMVQYTVGVRGLWYSARYGFSCARYCYTPNVGTRDSSAKNRAVF